MSRKRPRTRPVPTRSERETARIFSILDDLEAHRPKRRITVADHERFRATGEPPHQGDADLEEGRAAR